jgi:hypothetical protein
VTIKKFTLESFSVTTTTSLVARLNTGRVNVASVHSLRK